MNRNWLWRSLLSAWVLAAVDVIAVLVGVGDPLFLASPQPASALGTVVLVTTAVDAENGGDGYCSLREAIKATNANGIYNECDPTTGGLTGTDSIRFESSITSIALTSTLPAITRIVNVNGSIGGSRVVLHGNGSFNGLGVADTADGTTIRNLVLNGFSTAITVDHANDVSISSNYIGTNATGTAAVPNSVGIFVYGAAGTTTIGGPNGLSTGGSCTGDCNLISGNTNYGVDVLQAYGGNTVVQGNYIGTDVTGTSDLGNSKDGIYVSDSNATIGSAGAGNLISGNQENGIEFVMTLDMSPGAVVQANLIGTDTTGTTAIPNTQSGMYLRLGGQQYPMLIGGISAGAGNTVSGNAVNGIDLDSANNLVFQANRIGTTADGLGDLGNQGKGFSLYNAHGNEIGGPASEQGNTIAFNGDNGIRVFMYAYYNQFRRNSIHDNAGKGIQLDDNQNNGAFTPTVTGVNPVTGTSCANCIIDVFSDSADEGEVYEGTAIADAAGNWTFGNPVSGPNVTATATTAQTNANTSEFSAPLALPATPTPSPSFTLTPTPTSSPTPTPTPTGRTSSPTPTPTTFGRTPTPTPTPTPMPTASATSNGLTQGDVDCSGGITSVDALKELRYVAQISVSQNEPCPDIGTDVASIWGDVDCSGSVTSVDALKVLRHVVSLPVQQAEPCPDIGTPEN